MQENLTSVLLASQDYRQDPNNALLETKVQKGLTTYTPEQYNLAKELTLKQIQKDMKNGNVNKYTLKLSRDPKALVYSKDAGEQIEKAQKSQAARKEQARLKRQQAKAAKQTLVMQTGETEDQMGQMQFEIGLDQVPEEDNK